MDRSTLHLETPRRKRTDGPLDHERSEPIFEHSVTFASFRTSALSLRIQGDASNHFFSSGDQLGLKRFVKMFFPLLLVQGAEELSGR